MVTLYFALYLLATKHGAHANKWWTSHRK